MLRENNKPLAGWRAGAATARLWTSVSVVALAAAFSVGLGGKPAFAQELCFTNVSPGGSGAATGDGSLACGANSNAVGPVGGNGFDTALGPAAQTAAALTGVGSVQGATAVGSGPFIAAVPYGAQALGDGASAFGAGYIDPTTGLPQVGAIATGNGASAFGAGFVAASGADVASASATGVGASAFGSASSAAAGSAAFGFNSNAGGGSSVAIGSNTQTTAAGAIAIGGDATAGQGATATGERSIALGAANLATPNTNAPAGSTVGAHSTAADAIAVGTNAYAEASTTTPGIAIGRNATALGSVGLGDGALAAGNGTAIGDATVATGSSSAALGFGATATQANATAIGTGAATQYANQMALGTGANTYWTPGITSLASAATQLGPLELVTTDASGHLASDGGQVFSRIAKGEAGIAIAMAIANPDLVANERFGLAVNFGGFNGTSAIGVSATGVLGRNWVGGGERWALAGGIGFSTGSSSIGGQSTSGQVGGRGGLQITW